MVVFEVIGQLDQQVLLLAALVVRALLHQAHAEFVRVGRRASAGGLERYGGDGTRGGHRYLLNNEIYSSNANRRLRR